MATATQVTQRPEAETIRRHREMFERRLRELNRSGGLTSKQIIDSANDPSRFRRTADAGSDMHEEPESE